MKQFRVSVLITKLQHRIAHCQSKPTVQRTRFSVSHFILYVGPSLHYPISTAFLECTDKHVDSYGNFASKKKAKARNATSTIHVTFFGWWKRDTQSIHFIEGKMRCIISWYQKKNKWMIKHVDWHRFPERSIQRASRKRKCFDPMRKNGKRYFRENSVGDKGATADLAVIILA